MLDVKFLREDLTRVKERMATRGTEIDWDEFVYLDQQRRDTLARIEKLKERKNRLSGEIGKVKKSGGDATVLMREVEEVSETIRKGEEPLAEIEARFEKFMLTVPNLPEPSVPVGRSAAENREVRRWGDPPQFDFPAKNHWDIGEELGILDFTRAAKIAGARFALYKDAGARLERALINFMLDLHTQKHGYREVLPPFLVNRDAMTGTGQLPKFEEDLFRVSRARFLSHSDRRSAAYQYPSRREYLNASNLPIQYVAYTPCFRREAGSYGKDVRGLIRQHQFNKVELVKFTEPEALLRGVGKHWLPTPRRSCGSSSCPIAWSSFAPAIWASLRRRHTTWKYGCRVSPLFARLAPVRISKTFKPAGRRFATEKKRRANRFSFTHSTAPVSP